jgi:hypothetical protein
MRYADIESLTPDGPPLALSAAHRLQRNFYFWIETKTSGGLFRVDSKGGTSCDWFKERQRGWDTTFFVHVPDGRHTCSVKSSDMGESGSVEMRPAIALEKGKTTTIHLSQLPLAAVVSLSREGDSKMYQGEIDVVLEGQPTRQLMVHALDHTYRVADLQDKFSYNESYIGTGDSGRFHLAISTTADSADDVIEGAIEIQLANQPTYSELR